VRQRFVEQGLEAALVPKPTNRTYARKLAGEGEARRIALACAAPPAGRKRWTLHLLAERMVASRSCRTRRCGARSKKRG
jgi:hypothetical protein